MIDLKLPEPTKLEGIIVTIDGPAGSGKTSTAREVAGALDYRHLDSGSLYRAATFSLLRESINVKEWEHLTVSDLDLLNLQILPVDDKIIMSWDQKNISSEIRSAEVTEKVSYVASLPQVRKWLFETQQNLGLNGRLVADGRDMGEVVFPEAEVKIFLTASLEVRARRRLLEYIDPKSHDEMLDDEMKRINKRDLADQNRRHSPLVQAQDAIQVDTTELTFHQQVKTLLGIIKDLTGIGS
tara:strand:+ start:27 stop:746 length:720 start_codon:yes stop_codon:yes gene_type:complete